MNLKKQNLFGAYIRGRAVFVAVFAQTLNGFLIVRFCNGSHLTFSVEILSSHT